MMALAIAIFCFMCVHNICCLCLQRKRLSITTSTSDRSDSECGDVPNGSSGPSSQQGFAPIGDSGSDTGGSVQDKKQIIVKVNHFNFVGWSNMKTIFCVLWGILRGW